MIKFQINLRNGHHITLFYSLSCRAHSVLIITFRFGQRQGTRLMATHAG